MNFPVFVPPDELLSIADSNNINKSATDISGPSTDPSYTFESENYNVFYYFIIYILYIILYYTIWKLYILCYLYYSMEEN